MSTSLPTPLARTEQSLPCATVAPQSQFAHSAKSQWRYIRYAVTLGSLLHLPAMGAGLTLDFEIPALQVAEYHKPYIAVWIERPDQSVATTLTVWYDLKKPNAEGTKWLKDLRQWWRRTGRDLELPIDGVSSPTRPAGTHQIRFNEKSTPPFQLAAGKYTLMIEASREVGGRELLSLPFEWPPQKAQTSQAQGKTELGKIQLEIKP